MARTPSTMMPLGTKAPVFELPNVVLGENQSLDELKGSKATVIMFICNHCPFVIHVIDELVSVAKDYSSQGVSFIAISSNDADNYPQDGPKEMKQLAVEKSFPFPYLYDESQDIANAYDAACTPDFFMFDSEMSCKYRGQLDASRPGNDIPVTGSDLRLALDNLLADKAITADQKPSIGCNIKWK